MIPKSAPCRAIKVSRRYRPARSHLVHATTNTAVCSATSSKVIEPGLPIAPHRSARGRVADRLPQSIHFDRHDHRSRSSVRRLGPFTRIYVDAAVGFYILPVVISVRGP
jgi:hypothetical protein